MTSRTPIAVERSLRTLGQDIAAWRKLQRVTTAQLAERAGMTRDTLRSIEQGTGRASSENLLRVLRVLGVMEAVVAAADPYATDVGKLRVDERLPQRVRN